MTHTDHDWPQRVDGTTGALLDASCCDLDGLLGFGGVFRETREGLFLPNGDLLVTNWSDSVLHRFSGDGTTHLVASALPNNAFGYFLTSRMQGFTQNPGGSTGNLCLGGSIGRFQQQIQNTGTTGAFTTQANLTAFPSPTSTMPVAAGETWSFQAWHRDAVGGSATSNFTVGLEVLFR